MPRTPVRLVLLLAFGVLFVAWAAEAQPPAKVARIGYLSVGRGRWIAPGGGIPAGAARAGLRGGAEHRH